MGSVREKIKAMCLKRVAKNLLFILLLEGLILAEATASNTIKDMQVAEQDDRTRILFLVDRLPSFAVDSLSPNRSRVTLFDASPAFRSDETKGAGAVSIIRNKPGAGDFTVLLNRLLREASFDWLEEKKLFCLDLFWTKAGDEGFSSSGASSLKDIRFGEWEAYTRVVLEMKGRPCWEFIDRGGKEATVRLAKTDAKEGEKGFGPLKRFAGVTLKRDKPYLQLAMTPKSPMVSGRIFWLKMGDRLVMDVYDSPRLPAEVAFPSRSGVGRKASENERGPAPAPTPIQHASAYVYRGKISPEAKAKVNPEKDSKTPSVDPSRTINSIDFEKKTAPPTPPSRETGPPELDSEEALLYGRILEAYNFKDYERGIALIDRFIRKFPSSPLLEKIAFLKADFQFFLGESGRKELLPEIEASYKAAIQQFGESSETPKAYLKLAQVSRLAGNPYQAIGYLNILIGRYPQKAVLPLAYLERGNLYLESDSPEKALKDFKALIEDHPKSTLAQEARYGIAKYLHGQKLYQEADKWLSEIDAAAPDFCGRRPEYLSLHAQNDLYLKRYSEAREEFYKALNVGGQPEPPDLLLAHIGDTYLHESKKEEAEKVYRAVVDGYPDSEGASISQLRLADLYSKMEGIEKVQRQNADTPIGELAELKMANAFYNNGQFTEAIKCLKELVSSGSNKEVRATARVLFYRTAQKEMTRLYRSKQYEGLVELFKSNEPLLAGKIQPEIQLLAAKSLFRLGRYLEAVSAFRQLDPMDLDKSKADYFRELAQSYLKSGDPDRAVQLLEKSRKVPPLEADRKDLTRLLADTYRQRFKPKEAYRLYEELIGKKGFLSDKEKGQIYCRMGEILNDRGKPEEARALLERSVSLTRKDPNEKAVYLSALAELGESWQLAGNEKEAVGRYEEALRAGLGPEDARYWDVKYKLAEAFLDDGQPAKAEKIFKEISEEGDPDLASRAQVELGSIHLERQLKRLSIWSELGGADSVDVKQ